MGSQSIEVGVLIATCDRHQMLKNRSVASVLNQTFQPDYIVVVDDSKDDKERLKNKNYIQSLQVDGARIDYLSNSRTKGASGAWNTGIFHLASICKSMDSTFLAILDDDDEWTPEYISQCVDVAKDGQNDMVAADIARIKDIHLSPSHCPAPDRLVASDFLVGNPGIQGSNLFLKLSVMLQAGCFDEAMKSSTDRDICIRICDLGDTRYKRVRSTLVKHYAELGRKRMTTRGSRSKNEGQEYFFRKYIGRMTNKEMEGFLERAERLFGWHPGKGEIERMRPKKRELRSLVIAFEFNESLISYFDKVENEEIIGLTLVIHGKTSSKKFHEAIISLRNRGYSCYPLFEKQTFGVEAGQVLVECSKFLCSKRPGSTGWLICDQTETSTSVEVLGTLRGKKIPLEENIALDEKLIHYLESERIKTAEARLNQSVDINDTVCLGLGSEAVVFTDKKTVFKVIDYWKTRDPRRELKFLQSQVGQWRGESNLFNLEEIIHDGPWAIITYDYEKSRPYEGGFESSMLDLMASCRRNGIVCNNIHPKNLVIASENVKLIDYGSDIRPWNPTGEEMMLRRAYLSVYFPRENHLNKLHRLSLNSIDFEHMKGYPEFKQKYSRLIQKTEHNTRLLGIGTKQTDCKIIFGVITNQPTIASKLLVSISTYFPGSQVVLLDNHCELKEKRKLLDMVEHLSLDCTIVGMPRQAKDAVRGKFGDVYSKRPKHKAVGIAQARTMVQFYVGQLMLDTPESIGWILDDDMVFDERAATYTNYLLELKKNDVDVVIGTYDGASPNPPINALRIKLVDFVYNISWLNGLPPEASLPDRKGENQTLKAECSDYYYDLSRKHFDHLERPVWLEPQYGGETVKEAKTRLLLEMNGALAGHPVTRPVAPHVVKHETNLKDSVNRGGNTIIFNPEAITKTPNLIFSIHGHEARRSDMIWAIINTAYRNLTIKVANIPILHQPRYSVKNKLDSKKVIAEIMGSCLYAGLLEHLSEKGEHFLGFNEFEADAVSEKSLTHLNVRKSALRWNLTRINGLLKTASSFFEKDELPDFIRILNNLSLEKVIDSVEEIAHNSYRSIISEFLSKIIANVDDYANKHQR